MNNNMYLDAKPREPITRWNRRSDIRLTLNLFSRGVKYYANATNDDLIMVFYTDKSRRYACSRRNGVLSHCEINADGSVTCFLDKPRFNPGRLHAEVYVTSADTDFNDLNYTACKVSCLPIVIVDGVSDDVDPNVSTALSLPYIEVTVYDALVGHGYLGTSDEFWRKFVGLMAGNSITADGAIRIVLASMGEEYDGAGATHEQVPGECVYDGSRYQIAYMDNNGDITYYSPSADLVYCNALTDKLYRWNGSGWTLINGGETVIQNRYVSNAAVVGNRLIISSTGGGTASATVIANVNTLQAKIDELISKLSNSAFNVSPKPDPVGAFDWSSGDDEGGDTPTTYYSISIPTSTMYTMSNASTSIAEGQPYTNVISANTGYHLTGITINGVAQQLTDDSQFTISIPSVTGNITIAVSAEADEVQPTTSYSVSVTATDLDVSPNGGTVLEGGTFQCTLALATGVTGKRLPRLDEITINGTHGTATLSNAVLTIPNIQSDITIIASAVATSGVSHSVTYNLFGADKTSGDDSVDDGTSLTAVLAKDSSTWPSGEQGGEIAPAQEAFLARDIIVYMGGIPLVKGTDYSVSQSSPNSAVTVIVNNVTADILIANIVWTAERINSGKTAFIQVAASYVARYRASSLVPIPNECTEMSVVNNDDKTYGTTNPQLGVCFYDENEDFVGYENSKGHQVLTFEVPSSAKYVRMAGNNWYQSKDSNGYGSGGSNTTGIDYAFYIYDDTNGKFVWKGTYVTETINTDNEPTE